MDVRRADQILEVLWNIFNIFHHIRVVKYLNKDRTSPPQIIWEEHVTTSYQSWQRMHSSVVCASCAMSTAHNCYSATGTLHPYHFSTLTHRSLTVTLNLKRRIDYGHKKSRSNYGSILEHT